MTDDLLTRMRRAVGAGQMIKALDDGAAEIERLHHDLDRSMAREHERLQEVERLRALLREVRCAYWIEIDRNTIPSDPPDPLLERLNAEFGDKPWTATESPLKETP